MVDVGALPRRVPSTLLSLAIVAATLTVVPVSTASASDPIPVGPASPPVEIQQLEVLPESVTGFDVEEEPPVEVVPTSIVIAASASGRVAGTVLDADAQPVAGIQVAITAKATGESTESAHVVTDDQGRFDYEFDLAGGTWTFEAKAGELTSSARATIGSNLALRLSIPQVKSERVTTLKAGLTDRGRSASGRAVVEVLESGKKKFQRIAVREFSRSSGLNVQVKPWRTPTYRVSVTRNSKVVSKVVKAKTTRVFSLVKAPRGMKEPKTRTPVGAIPQGSGSNTVIRKIPNATWKSMRGLSWRKGCTSRSRLSLVETNFRGFDGYRHRGQLIVGRAIGPKIKRAFQRFYKAKYPIRRMQLVDVFGKNAKGRPGANDYRSMAADNTSSFNCRYVVGREASRARSPHATGRSIDVNPWENPYVVGRNTWPNRDYLNRRAKHPAMLKSGSKATRIMRGIGCRWGGSYLDYHHWDC